MAKDSDRVDPGYANDLQDVGVRRLQGQASKPLYTEGGGWLLSLGAVRLRNLHIQSRPKHKGCGECGEGLARVLEEVAEDAAPDDEVVEGAGADDSGDPPPTSGDGDDPGHNPYRLFQ